MLSARVRTERPGEFGMILRLARCVLIVSSCALLGAAAPALAARGGGHGGHFAVPELDPAAVGAVAALVAGGALLVARRRKP